MKLVAAITGAMIAGATLAGCQAAGTAGGEIAAAPVAGAICDAAPIQHLVGKPAVAVEAEAKRGAGAGSVRKYESGSAVTMDYRADRLNIETDAAGVIVRLGCG